MAQKDGTAIFPREVMNRFPLLPLEEEARLNDLPLRELERIGADPELAEGPTITGRTCGTCTGPAVLRGLPVLWCDTIQHTS